MDFTIILKKIKTPKNLRKSTHATGLLLYYSKPKKGTNNVLELGCGVGLVCIGLSLLYNVRCVGIDIQCELVEIAKDIAITNGLYKLVDFLCGDVAEYKNLIRPESYDMVVANPPHILNKEKSPKTSRKFERSVDEKTMENFVKATFWSLKNGGEYVFVVGVENMVDWIYLLRKYRLEPKKMVFFHPKDKAELLAIRGRKNGKKGVIVEKPLGG